jgi:hypothetical protein
LVLGWCAATSLVAVTLFVLSGVVGWSGGVHGGLMLVILGGVVLALGPTPWVLVFAVRTVKWVRVLPDRGVHVSSGALLTWAEVTHAVPDGRSVAIFTRGRPPMTLRDVEDAQRFAALVGRFAKDGPSAAVLP